MLIWKYYIKNLTKEEKATLIRKVLFVLVNFQKNVIKNLFQLKKLLMLIYYLVLKEKYQKIILKLTFGTSREILYAKSYAWI